MAITVNILFAVLCTIGFIQGIIRQQIFIFAVCLLLFLVNFTVALWIW